METLEILRLVVELLAGVVLFVLSRKTIRYKNIIVKIIEAAKDLRVTEQEFDDIINEIRREIYG